MAAGEASDPAGPERARIDLVGQVTGFIVSRAVHEAARLGLADLLADGPRSCDELAASAQADAEALRRLLRALSGYGIFFERDDGTFANSEASALLRDESLRDLSMVLGEHFYPAFAELSHTLRTGEPAFDRAFGASFFEALGADPEAGARFNRFMTHGTEQLADFLAREELGADETVVDVGGGNGALLHALLDRLPTLQGVLVELASVAREAERRGERFGDRCEVVVGSFFEELPTGADVYVLSRVLHDWEDPDARRVLDQVRRAIPDEGRLLVVEGVVGPSNTPVMRIMDMLMMCIGGRERTAGEWEELLASAGFELDGIRDTGTSSLIDARPARV